MKIAEEIYAQLEKANNANEKKINKKQKKNN